MADRVGVVIPGGDLDHGRVERVERVRQIEDGQSLVGRDGLEPRDRLGAGCGLSALPTRGMITIASGTAGCPALRGDRAHGLVVQTPVNGLQAYA